MTVQIVQSRRDVSHQGHEEERDLKDMVCHEVQAFHNLLIPIDRIEINDERQEPQGDPDSDDLAVGTYEHEHVHVHVHGNRRLFLF